MNRKVIWRSHRLCFCGLPLSIVSSCCANMYLLMQNAFTLQSSLIRVASLLPAVFTGSLETMWCTSCSRESESECTRLLRAALVLAALEEQLLEVLLSWQPHTYCYHGDMLWQRTSHGRRPRLSARAPRSQDICRFAAVSSLGKTWRSSWL